MAYQFDRLEKFLLAGLVVTGVGLAIDYVRRTVDDSTPPGGVAIADSTPDWPPLGKDRTWTANQLPPEHGGWEMHQFPWLHDDYVYMESADGEKSEGSVVNVVTIGQMEIQYIDRRTGHKLSVPTSKLSRWWFGRKPRDWNGQPYYQWFIQSPGGGETILEGFLLSEDADTFELFLPEGRVVIEKSCVKKYVPYTHPLLVRQAAPSK